MRVLCSSSVTASVAGGRLETGRLGLAVELRVSLPGVDRATAGALAAAAHEEICPYSRAIRGNVAVTVTVE